MIVQNKPGDLPLFIARERARNPFHAKFVSLFCEDSLRFDARYVQKQLLSIARNGRDRPGPHHIQASPLAKAIFIFVFGRTHSI
jgi:hypothetical protein